MNNNRGKYFLLGFLYIAILACGPLTINLSSTEIPTPQTPIVPQTTETEKPSPTLTSEPTSTQGATSAGLARINIYLVAVGDNGISGKMIGCGDSLVPVEIGIEPTLGVLRAAIIELLKLEGQSQYGQSGLYNALSLSSLTLEDVYIINRKAVIEFTGDLIYGGECDIPRIEEQLKALALQFSTVDRVTIFVNGELLENLLDLRG